MGVAAALVAVVATGCTAGANAPDPTSTSTSTKEVVPFTAQRATQMSADLGAGTAEGIRGALGLPAAQDIDPGVAQALAAAGPVTFDVASFRILDSTHATVTATWANPPAGQAATWQVDLVLVDGAWVVSATQEAP